MNRIGLGRALAAGTGSAAANVALLAVSGWLIVRAADQPPMLTLLVAIVGVRAFGLARAGLRWLERMSAHRAALRLAEQTRLRLWRALTRQGPAADRTPGHALARLVGDVDQLRDLSVRVLVPPVVAGLTMAGTGLAMALVDAAAASVAVLLLAATVGAAFLAHQRIASGAERREVHLRGELLRRVSNVLDAAPDLRAHGRTGAAADALAGLGRDLDQAVERGGLAAALDGAVLTVGSGLAGMAAALVAATGDVSGPACAALALAPLALAEPLQASVAAWRRRTAWRDTQERIHAVLDLPGPAEPRSPAQPPPGVPELSLRDVAAGWPGQATVVSSVTAAVGRGPGWLVVRGPSGSGKSTLLAVLMAALRPRAGEYRLAGHRTAALSGADIRRHIAWCPQDAHIFASTIRANLCLGLPPSVPDDPLRPADRTTDVDSRLWTVLRRVGLADAVAAMPDGLDTHVGSGGSRLSGGERRRLAVARTLLTERDVVLLDEPTAHLDPPAARALVADLRRALHDRVVVCVTHDPAVVAPGDAVLDLGQPALRSPGGDHPTPAGARRPVVTSRPGMTTAATAVCMRTSQPTVAPSTPDKGPSRDTTKTPSAVTVHT